MKHSKNYLTLLIFVLIMIFSSGNLFSDSPLTSTSFYKAYTDIEIIEKASMDHLIDSEEILYLLDSNNSLDKRLALVNAKGFSIVQVTSTNSSKFLEILKEEIKNKNISINSKQFNNLTLILSYLYALDEYYNPETATELLKKLKDSSSISKTSAYQLVKGLSYGNIYLNSDQCRVWKEIEVFFNNPDTKNSFREEAIKIIMEYMILYKKNCD